MVSRKLYDRAVGTAKSPSLAPLAPGAAATSTRSTSTALGVADGRRRPHRGRQAGTVVLPLVANAARAAGHACWSPFNQPGGTAIDGRSSTPTAPATDVRVERM